ncbi:MAG: hypothetical protein HC893_15255, partial [Chloroflexaceae bacterium]|nr:hypothetical protein [Chloroflexaceae bacterium]
MYPNRRGYALIQLLVIIALITPSFQAFTVAPLQAAPAHTAEDPQQTDQDLAAPAAEEPSLTERYQATATPIITIDADQVVP